MDPLIRLCGLLFSCPHGKNDPFCPLFAIRQLPIPERLSIIKLMSFEKLREMEQDHISCAKKDDRNEGSQ